MIKRLRAALLPVLEAQRAYAYPRFSGMFLGQKVGIIGSGPSVRRLTAAIAREVDVLVTLNGSDRGLSWSIDRGVAAQWDDTAWTPAYTPILALVSERSAWRAPTGLPVLIFPHELPVGLQGCLPRTVLACRLLGATSFVCYACDAVNGREHLTRFDDAPGSLSYFKQQEAAAWAALDRHIEWRCPSGLAIPGYTRELSWGIP